MGYEIGKLPLEALIGPVGQATETLVRLDERLAHSPLRDGWIARMHFHDAVAAMWIDGELVHLEDLVFRDAEMDQRTPTHELTRAHAVLRRRRRILSQARDWALGRQGRCANAADGGKRPGRGGAASDPADLWEEPEADRLVAEFAEIVAAAERLDGCPAQKVPRERRRSRSRTERVSRWWTPCGRRLSPD